MLQAVGARLMSQLDLDVLVQDATETATKATGAAFGAFFYNLVDDHGESYTLYTLAGVPRAAFERFPMPRNTQVFAPTFNGEAVGPLRRHHRRPALRPQPAAPRHAGGAPAGAQLPRGAGRVADVPRGAGRLLLRAPRGPAGSPSRTSRSPRASPGTRRSRSTTPACTRASVAWPPSCSAACCPPSRACPGFAIVSRYLPAALGSEVGGDWIDVMELPGRPHRVRHRRRHGARRRGRGGDGPGPHRDPVVRHARPAARRRAAPRLRARRHDARPAVRHLRLRGARPGRRHADLRQRRPPGARARSTPTALSRCSTSGSACR